MSHQPRPAPGHSEVLSLIFFNARALVAVLPRWGGDFAAQGVAPAFPWEELPGVIVGREGWRRLRSCVCKTSGVFTRQDNNPVALGKSCWGLGGCPLLSDHQRKSQARVSTKLQPAGQELEAVPAELCSCPHFPQFRGLAALSPPQFRGTCS